ncbi:immunoglobulin-like and fibronectin type III domain-containing protein 1 isoform X34 [Phaenicophaeus curvirostris]|uniref:immunoglobulin-like and fibronectin type III domain-containing protein 1 isoform X34 n=1 Tax=Phaenicophaeus curvirostris TaxID=33595 RepID=UPI0037F0CBD2
MTGHQTVKSFKKSSVPGVVITQFVDEIPKGCSTPDFEKKPITLTLQEGKNAIFRAVVKGVPTPEVKWTRTQGGMDDPDKYQAFFNNATNEFILQINKPTVNDSDLYRCLAVNEYGEAACSAGLRIIQVGFKRKTKYVPVHPAEELKKNLQDFRKLLRKRAPVQKPKPLDMEAVWQLLLHADRRDYEKICIKYGIVDFRGMLRKLQEIKKDTESEQGELIHSIKNFEHIKVNKDGKASFSLEMDLKNSKSKVYLLKDGEKLRYGTGDEYRKHCLRRIGKRYNFIVNDVQPEDAGVYQVRVEDVPVFSTELEAESIPVRFEQPLSDIRCPEEENAVFECVLRTPCYDAVWLHKTHLLEASEKHQISVTPDGLTHRLVIKNVVPSDNGMYTLDTGLCSSNAWLIVEYAKGKRRQGEGGEREKPEQLKETLPDKERAKKPRHREYVDNEDHLIDTGMEKNGWYRNGQDGSQGHSVDVDGSHHRFLGKDGLREVHKNERMGSGQFSRAGLDGDSMTNDDSSFELSILGSKSRLRPIQGKDSPAGRADTGHEFGRAGEGYPVDGRDDDMLGAVVDGGEGVGGQLDKDGRLGDSYRAGFGGGGRLDATDGSSRLDGLNPDSTRVGGGKGDLFSRNSLGTGTRKNAAGTKTAGGMRSPHGKDGPPTAVDMNGASINREGQTGSPYGKDSLALHASGHLDQAGRSGLLYGPGHLPAGDGAICGEGGSSIGKMAALYGPDGQPVGAGIYDTGVAGAGAFGSPCGKDGFLAGSGLGGAGIAGAGGIGSSYGQDGLPAGGGVGGATVGFGGAGFAYGKDGLLAGAGAGGTGGFGSPYGKDGLPAGAGAGGVGVRSPYGKDGLPAGASVGGAAVGGYGGAASPYGEGVLPAGVVAGAVQFPFVGKEGMGSHHGRNAMLSRAQGYLGGAGGGDSSSEVSGMGGSAARSVRSPYSKDSGSAGARAGVDGDGRELLSIHGGEVVLGAVGRGGEYGLDSHPGKSSVGGETAKGTASAFRGSGISGSPHDRDSLSGQRDAGGKGGDLGQLGSHYGKNSALGGAGSTSHDSSVTGSSSAFGQGSLRYGQMADLYGGPPSINHRKPELELDLKENDFLKNTESLGNKRRYCLDDLKAPRCHLNKQLLGVRVLKGEPAELSCTVSKEDVMGTWFKDGLKLKSMDGVVFEKEGLVHKLIINKVEDIHAGKYRFEGGDIKTEASIFVEDPPQVDKVLLKNLTSVPTVAKAGQKVQIKIPFEGRLPVRAMWLKDKMELIDDTRIRVDNTETFTMLSIASSERKDCGDYKVRLKNDSGVLEINLKLLVLDKPQPPAGPIKIVQSSINDITIQWKPPKDDGGKPLQRYIVERQQVGKSDWVTLGETPKTCTTFTTNKVEQDMSYYFRVRAVNAEGTSDPLESDEVKAVGKASPGAPDAPEIVSTSKDSITISWKAPRKTGSSRIVGYIVQKRKKGTMTWLPVNNAPVSDKKLKITNLKKGLQYEFRVAAVNGAGIGDASGPSQPAFARDCTKTLGPVQDLKVSSSDSSSVTLTWKTPETKNGSDVKGYEVELRPSTSLNWTKCTTLPLEMTTYTVKGLQAKEKYFLRVRALNDSGPGEATEVEAHMEAAPPVVSPRFLIDDTVKSFLLVKAGDTIRVNIPFEASPDPVVTWLKDGQLLPNQAAITTKDGTTQLLIGAAEFTDTGTYTIKLQNGLGKRETFSFQVQVTDIPQPPGPIHLEENVPNTVTVTWEPSASERWESHLYYTVLKRESEKGLWHVVGDLIYNNKFTFTQLIPGRDYYFKVVAKNCLGASSPSETVKPWRIQKTKAESKVKPQQYRGVNQSQPPRILVPLKPHVVTTGSECHMSCAVAGHPSPKITWYKDSRDLSSDPAYLCTNDFGVCSLVILGVTAQDEGEYMVEASNEMGRAFSKAFLTIKDSTL